MSKTVSRLYTSFQPKHYDLNLSLDLDTNLASGSVVIKGQKQGRPSQRLTFHGHGLSVSQATIIKHDKKQGDIAIPVERINLQKTLDEIRLHSDAMLYAGDYTITLQFTAPIQTGMHGIYRSEHEIDGQTKTLISTQFESHHAREAFPCIDEPEAKASFQLQLTAPKDYTILGNMPISSQTETAGRLEVSFETTPKMSTYLLAFVVGELHERSTKTKDGVKVSVWATKDHSPEALDFAVDTTKRCIEFFNDYYGLPYPLPKCDMIAIPSFSSGAMENWGLVTFRESCLLADPATSSQSGREVVALVVCHELSHQWFGNLVTMKWWDDLWLNESFANVMEYVAVDALFPDWHVFNTFVASEGMAAFRRDSIAGVQAIKTEVRHPDEISTLFDPSIVYAKGGRLLNMLRTYVGEEAFRAGLKQYFIKHQYGNTTGDDLWQALSAASNKDVASFMNPWLTQSGFPLVTVDQHGKHLTVSQSHFLLDQSKADNNRRWPIPLLATDSSASALLDGRELSIELASDGFIRLNQAAVGHYVVRYSNPDHMAWVAGQAESKALNEVERLILLSDSTMLARSGVESLASSLRLLGHYTHETSEPVWNVMASVVGDVRRFVDADPSMEDSIKALIRQLIEEEYQRLGWQELPDEASQDTKQRATILGLGTYAEHPEIKAEALRLFEAYKTDTTIVSSELRGIVFTSAVRYKATGAFDYLLKLEETTSNPDLKQELLGSLSASHSEADGARLLARLKDPKKVRLHDVDHWLVLLMRNRHNQAQAWQWLRDNWQWIKSTFAGDKSYDTFPRYAAGSFNSRQRLDEYRQFFGPMAEEPLLARNITMGIEELENRIAWIERDLTDLQQFFKNQPSGS